MAASEDALPPTEPVTRPKSEKDEGSPKASGAPRLQEKAKAPTETAELAQARQLLEGLLQKHVDSAQDAEGAGTSSGEKKKVGVDLIKLKTQIWELFSPEKTDIDYLESVAFRNKIRLVDHGCGKQPKKKKIHLKELIENLLINPPKTEEQRALVKQNRKRQVKNSKERLIEALGAKLQQTVDEINKRERLDGFEADDDESAAQMECNYVYVSRLKKRALEIYEKMQELECNLKSTMRESRRPITLKSSAYPELNRAAGKMATRCLRKDLVPDFTDVLTVVRRVNESEDLGMNSEKQRTIGVELFREIAEEIKKRRVKETRLNIESLEIEFSQEGEDDPAEKDAELEARLKASEAAGRERIAAVINEFADKQIEGADVEEKSDAAQPRNDKDSSKDSNGKGDRDEAEVEEEDGKAEEGSEEDAEDDDKAESEVDESYLFSNDEDSDGENLKPKKSLTSAAAVIDEVDDAAALTIDLDENESSDKPDSPGLSGKVTQLPPKDVPQTSAESEPENSQSKSGDAGAAQEPPSDPESLTASSKNSRDMVYIESLADDDSSPPPRSNGFSIRSRLNRADAVKRRNRRSTTADSPAMKKAAVIELSDDSEDAEGAGADNLLGCGSAIAGKLRALGTNVVPVGRPFTAQAPEVIEIDSD